MSFFLHRDTHVALYPQLNRCVIILSEEERSVAILLTVEVVFETEDVIGAVLVHRGVGIGTNNKCRIGTVADKNHRNHNRDRIEPTCRDESTQRNHHT